MKKIIDIETHAFFRMIDRGNRFGLDYHETKDRAFRTVRLGKLAKRKHLSRTNKTYYHYLDDNLSFFVICQEKGFENYVKVLIRTVIIEQGME